MNHSKVVTALNIFTYYLMEDASEKEIRLTFYLLSIFTGIDQDTFFILKDEVLLGAEKFNDSGKRTRKYLGAGIHKKDLTKAIDEVNDRDLIQIKGKSSGTLLVKLNLNYLKDASKEVFQ